MLISSSLLRAHDMDLRPNIHAQGHFAAVVKDVVSTVNARHRMAQAIAAYSELQSSTPQQEDSRADNSKHAEQEQNRAYIPAYTMSSASEQTTGIIETGSQTSQLSLAK